MCTYDASACRVDEDALAGRQAAELEQKDVCNQVVHGHRSGVQEAEVRGDLVHISGRGSHQLRPGAVLGEGNHSVPCLQQVPSHQFKGRIKFRGKSNICIVFKTQLRIKGEDKQWVGRMM